MNNYNLSSLSWIEFEDLTRDLFQNELGIYIESFTPGKDNGIDLRFAITNDKKAIVQCKRIDNFSTLYNQLKKEKVKLIGKNIDRYYIATTSGLTPNGKKKIFELFYPLIKNEADIFGKNDILNLIAKHSNVEKKYYKLWLTSSTVLQELLNAKVYNSSKIQMNQIMRDAKIYVHNNSFYEAQSILSENHYVIISGIPGIGKTTLARILVYNLLASGIHDLIYLTSNIGEAYNSYHENTKQVYLYDDFLGSNFLEDKLERNEDKELIDFIRKIKESKNKYFIMTTREYILNQAQQKYELLNKRNINIAKCVIDLVQYTPLVRGEILYKHLYFSHMPKIFLQELIKNKRYLNIINHKNFNPRIIETIMDKQIWASVQPDNYYTVFSSYFDNPRSVWEYAFKQHISHIGRVVVIILGSINGLVKLETLKIIVKSYFESVSYIGDFDIDFNGALKELAGSFIKIEKDDKFIDAVEFHNPSVTDFIHSYLLDNIDIIKSVVEKCYCLDQLITIYQIYKKNIPENIKLVCENKLFINFDNLNIIRLDRWASHKSGRPIWWQKNNTVVEKLSNISYNMFPLLSDDLLEYLKKLFFDEFDKITSNSSYETFVDIYFSFCGYLESEYFEYFIKHITQASDSLDQLVEIARLREIDNDIFDTIINSSTIKEKIIKLADDDYYNVDRGSAEYTRDIMADVSDTFQVDLNEYIFKLDDKIEEEKSKEDHIEVNKSSMTNNSSSDPQEKLNEMFETLLLR